MPKVDETGASVRVSKDDLVRVDGITICRRVFRDGVPYLQFQDRDRMRSNCRGSTLVEIPLSVLVFMLKMERPETREDDNCNQKGISR